MRFKKFLPLLIVFAFSSQFALAQGGYEDLLYREVEVVNPVYMPVIGIGTGVINYYGELKNDYANLLQGQPSFRLNVYQFLDNRHYWKANLNLVYGTLSGKQRSYAFPDQNANFETELLSVGLNIEYSFGNIYKGEKKIVPFISLGAEYIASFTAKTDRANKDGMLYEYATDGTIRIGDEIVVWDNEYETNIKSDDPYLNSGEYDASSYAAVLDAGFDFKVSNRVALRLASSFHYTFTDDLDGINENNTRGVIGDSQTDMFSFTYVSMNIDLFSSPKTIRQDLLFAEVEFDAVMLGDSDRDRILDLADDCPDTPRGVPVDSVGCPLDGDNDGVPDYIDKEQFTAKGVIVDEFGAALSANKIRENLFQDVAAVNREEVYMVPVGMGWSRYSEMTSAEIPEKYKKLDKDKDNYISFDELLEAINEFFDFDSEFTTDDIYDLNSFFFAQ